MEWSRVKIIKRKILYPVGEKSNSNSVIFFPIYGRECRNVGSSFLLIGKLLQNVLPELLAARKKVARKSLTGCVREWTGGSLSPRALDPQPGSRGKIRHSSEKAPRGPAPWGGPSPWTTLLHQSAAAHLHGPQPSRPGGKGTPYGGALTHYPLVPGEAKGSRLGIGAYSTAGQGHSSKDVTIQLPGTCWVLSVF